QGYRQGNDTGSQYRSAVYWTSPAQGDAYQQTRARFQDRLTAARYGAITTDGRPVSGGEHPAGPFYYAEDYHQQYLAKQGRKSCRF
ncbi:MAG TPA: peptide-methionine (S)-S-oxide reductase, partial [Methanobacterium sp.]